MNAKVSGKSAAGQAEALPAQAGLHDAGEGDACCAVDGERKSHHSDKVKDNLVSRLNRIEGQIRGVKGMIEKDTYCDDVLNQIAAIQSALNSVGKILLEGHMKSCVVERLEQGDKDVIDELLKTMGKLMK
ncbi:metal-sensitive transcriptional regulator [Paenibacillus doosanensis]|uniref:metal-sensitive transcriptional regulator n=1 Tax=Paenibacillus doosanensis TaxID=1229154 RepID=UPI00217F41D4|nr:metal-sensitive transcriptional regulator [Paenibacillus doosanensis]MCS7463286.1 metal-sensitive transcriptional regulator [Paenibacillus doosanensis]